MGGERQTDRQTDRQRERELDVFRADNRKGHVQYTMRKTPFKRSEKRSEKTRVGWG